MKIKNGIMSNMNHCRFENTFQDLKDCYEALLEEGSVEVLEKSSNEYEKPYIKKLISLCAEISDEFRIED